MKIGFLGLGKMGSQIVTKFLEAGHSVVVYDPNTEAVQAMVAKGALATNDRTELVQQLETEPQAIVWLMIPSDYISDEAQAWIDILPKGSILIDGGNSNYKGTVQRANTASDRGIDFIDIGTSGGVMGLANGFSMMIGGSSESIEVLRPLLEILAAPKGMFKHVGPSGAGHFVKMIHNGIEYGMMQAYAEGYQLLKENSDFGDLQMNDIAEVWQHGSIIESKLNQLVLEIYNENPALEGIDGYVADSGEGRWTLENAQQIGISMPVLQSAIDVRIASQNGNTNYATKLLAAMRNKFGGHAINKTESSS